MDSTTRFGLLSPWTVLLCIVLFSLSFAVSSSYAAGRLQVAPVQKDCGTIDEGSAAIMETMLENVGDSDLTITNVRTN